MIEILIVIGGWLLTIAATGAIMFAFWVAAKFHDRR